MLVPSARPAGAGVPAQAPPATCGSALPPGPIVEPPQIEMSSQPLNDRGSHELILNVTRAGDRFCYRYTLDGVEQSTAPILRVHPGETFAVRIVDQLHGPAPGATMAASALQPCKPQSMPDMMARPYVGYMNHVIESRMMAMQDVDVNVHFHGFEGSPDQDDVFLSALSTPAHACEYQLTVPITQPPGTYFYHPHAHGMADDEVAGGLSGMWIVEARNPELPASDDHAIILKYRIPFVINNKFHPRTALLENAANERERSLQPAPPVPFDPFNPPPWPSTIPMTTAGQHLDGLCGSRPGVAVAVDGVDAPGELTVPAGEPQRLRLLNATSDTVTYLRMHDATGRAVPMRIVAHDGIPVGGDDAHPLAQYVSQDEAPLVPSGRLDLLVTLQPSDVLT
ncbi:MAG: multicopper oxidase domain-containing protein, partial [Vulcanimicrobiaceae bacterium]